MLFETSIASTVPVLDDLPIFVDTNDFGPEDFQMFLECSNYINNSRSLQQKSGTSAVSSTKLHEELFEYNRHSGSREIIIDESFNVNSLSISMKNLFQYFNEDVNVMSGRESLDSLTTSNRDLHRPVIVDASPKLAPTVRYRPQYIQNPHQKNKRYQKNTLKPDRNSFPLDNLVLKASNNKDDYRRRSLDALHKANNLEFYSFTQVHSRPGLDPGCCSDNNNNEERNESENTISVKERVAFFNKLTESDSVDNEVPIVKKIEIPLEHVAVIKSKLYNSLSSAKVLATCEEPVLPEESVRSKIEKFENGQIRSPFQSRSTSQDTIKKDIISSTEELSAPLLVKSIQTRSKQEDSLVKCEQYLHSAKPLRYVSPYSRYSKSPDSLDSGSSTLGADSPHSESSSPSDYYSSSDGPRAVRYACPPYYSPSPPSLTPVSNDSEPKSNHPFIESGRNLRKLQDIARMIRNIRLQGFLDISQELFEQFLTMICACADICLVEGIHSCQGDLDEICSFLQPPENELQKSHDSSAALSEHQLRVQASLQRLNIPDWFRQYSSTPKTETGYRLSNFNRKRASESGRWAGLNSKTTSLSSLGSQRSDRSPLMLSPSAHSHHGGQTGFSRWSTSHLNSTQTSPSVSTRGSFSRGAIVNSSFISGHSVSGAVVRNSFRQPYLGWRSQEKLALSQPRTPHERLASSVLAQQQHQSHHQQSDQNQLGHEKTQQELPVTPEIQSSIKEVTSAIVHYVNDQTNRTSSRSRSTSPSSRKCWVESSFVGIKPVESPQTPIIDNSFNANAQQTASGQGTTRSTGATFAASTHSGASDILRMNGVVTADCTSPTAASLEDVLASLLGLPTDSYRSSGDTVNDFPAGTCLTSLSPNSLQVEQQNRLRRRSEGDAQRQQQHQQQKPKLETIQQQNPSSLNQPSDMLPVQSPRRVSLDSSESKTASDLLVRCRNTKCDQVALASEAKKTYKSCHNCSHQYCSRDCRRTHWEKHRKACLHSRVSNLCRQVLSSCKDDTDTLRHLSLLARKGYFSQGRGVVRILFRCPEGAEAFIKNGFQCLGEASYVRWPDLMPAEMGLELYSELLRLSTEYKPDSKLLIYVAICVVSEAPGTGTAPVKWERQLVSRCAKLKLCKTILNEVDPAIQQNAPPQEPFTEILILTFNTQKKSSPKEREIISVNIQTLLTRRGVSLRKHYPEIYQRLQSYVEGVTDKFSPVTIHPRDSQTGQGFVCIIMPNTGDTELSRLPKSDTGNRVSTFDVGEELFES